jgi:tetratricopeptide (TPR) repeat protein
MGQQGGYRQCRRTIRLILQEAEMLFSADLNASRAMTTLAEFLFREAQAFGKFSINARLTREKMETYTQDRLVLTKFILEILEHQSTLHFSDQERVPFIYNTNPELWPDSLPLAGYTDGAGQLKPSQVLTSLMLNWNLEITNNNTVPRLLAASLWMVDKHDLETALIYLIDLLKAGFIINTKSLAIVMGILLTTHTLVETDQAIVGLLTGNATLHTTSDWKRVEYKFDPSDLSIDMERNQAAISVLLNKILSEIEEVRDSSNYDDWLLGQLYVGGMITVFQAIMGVVKQEPSLGLKRILSQFEEIRADTPTLLLSIRKEFQPYINLFHFMKGTQIVFESQVGNGWQERFYQERLLVPARIKDQLLFKTGGELPPEWRYISWRIVHALIEVFQPEDRAIIMRSNKFDVRTLAGSQAIQDFFRRHRIRDLDQQNSILEYEYLDTFPKGFLDGQKLPSYPEDKLKLLLTKAHFDCSMEELQSALHQATELLKAKRYQEEIAYLKKLLDLYPWSSAVYHELSIAYDEHRDHQTAIDLIIPTIILYPTNPQCWRSLAVILGRLGCHDERIIASVIEEMLTERSRQRRP